MKTDKILSKAYKRISFCIFLLITMLFNVSCDEIGYTYSFDIVEFNHNCPEEDFQKVESYFDSHDIPYGSQNIYMSSEKRESDADRDARDRFRMIVEKSLSVAALDALELSPEFHFTYACIRGIENGASYIVIDSFSYPAQ